jgi:hypothetical protein
MDALQLLLFEQCGVISRSQALRHLTGSAVRHRLESGVWRVAGHGVYVTHTGPVTDEQRLAIAALVAGAGSPAIIAGISALVRMGLRGHRGGTVHVLLPARRRHHAPPSWVVVHRTSRLAREDLHARAVPPYTLPARSMLDAAQWARTDDDAVAIVAACFQQRLITGDEITDALARVPVARRRRLILAAVRDAAGGSHSLPEIEFLRDCRRAGLPEPSRQAVRTDAAGRTRYLDALFEQFRVHVEIDGGQHTDVRHWWADMRRQNDLGTAGYRLLRFPSYVIRTKPDEWVPPLRAALVAGGWRPPSR